MEQIRYYAHSTNGSKKEWQTLSEHSINVAEIAQRYASVFNAGDWGYIEGLIHDVGKCKEDFIARLFGSTQIVDHAITGAKYIFETIPGIGRIIAYCVAGHHSGLAEWKSNENSCINCRIERENNFQFNPSLLFSNILIPSRLPFKQIIGKTGFQINFFIRMLYSCLVDADFYDTENFYNKEKHELRNQFPNLKSLQLKFEQYIDSFLKDVNPSLINSCRKDILNWCLDAAVKKDNNNLFSLTVPTGGGKTLSSLAFALNHAILNEKNRIIYVIPYTSIIEQNAKIFRDVLGNDAVIEHHSNFDCHSINNKNEFSTHDLATENWDAPIVVTTNVQFFESFFAYKSSKCRKLHNIANSVIIFDEAQMLPSKYLRPCLEVIQELCGNYKSSVVLCTATQPALEKHEKFTFGLQNTQEIVKDFSLLFGINSIFKRTKIENIGKIYDNDLVEFLKNQNQVLCVVNTRKHAKAIYEFLKTEDGVFHLSASMCPVHRTHILNKIKKRLLNGQVCRVISTQLIECGVDLDFPIVFRSMTGLDSIIQAAGRCNRNGKFEIGIVYVFESIEHPIPFGEMQRAAAITLEVIRLYEDVTTPEAIKFYFQKMYWMVSPDNFDIKNTFKKLNEIGPNINIPFREVGNEFKLIETSHQNVIIPWDEQGKFFIQNIKNVSKINKRMIRSLQRYTVQIPKDDFLFLKENNSIIQINELFFVLNDEDMYSDDTGIFLLTNFK